MKQVILPVVIAAVLAVIALIVNPNIGAGGIFLAGLIGLGFGAAINNVLKVKKSAEKQK